MKAINVYAIYSTVNEYGNKGDLIFVTQDEVLANKHNKGVGWYGGDGCKEERKAVKAGEDTYYLIDKEVNYPIKLNEKVGAVEEKLKRNALNKLTKTEKQLLGLDDE